MPSVIIDMSSSMSVFVDKRDPLGSHFRWDSIKKFLYLATAYSNSIYNIDLFSSLFPRANLYQFLILQFVIGMPYSFMDFFIKLYTRRIDGGKFINPMMRGITFGVFAQTAMFALFNCEYLGDTIRYLFTNLRENPGWNKCSVHKNTSNTTCVSTSEVYYNCKLKPFGDIGDKTAIGDTSAHQYYLSSFDDSDRSIVTTKIFLLGIVWVNNFFLSSVTDDTLLKVDAVEPVTYMYGVGILGVHDFGTMSVFTMVDNAVVFYSLVYTVMGLVRSWVVRVMCIELARCVMVDEKAIGVHYFLYVIMPMGADMFHPAKLYTFYFYFNVLFTTSTHLTMLTILMSRHLHSEFTSVKIIYLVGLVCSLGFGASIRASTSRDRSVTDTIVEGIFVSVHRNIYWLAAMKSALVMWIYGVERFSTDINFWLGFKPTKYWTITWLCLPIGLIAILLKKVYLDMEVYEGEVLDLAVQLTWTFATVLLVVIFEIKTIAKLLVQNNLANIVSANKRYGPPDAEDRKRRRYFDETVQLRQCRHACNPFDEMIDCNHMPITRTSSGSMIFDEDSLHNIYEAQPTRLRGASATMDIT